ncbi:hypothetical protein CR513_26938, partial [Mucuna pruriens]
MAPSKDRQRDRSRSRSKLGPSYRGTISTISGGDTNCGLTTFERRRYIPSLGRPHDHLCYSYKKLGLLGSNLIECSSTLFGFTGEQVAIRGMIELKTTFGTRSNTRTILVMFPIVNAWASYNVILG